MDDDILEQSPGADYDGQTNMSQSQSESSLRNKIGMSSPLSNSTKDLVLSPLSKLAKGMQNISVHLDPRKLSGQVTIFLHANSFICFK
ncbi:unnamed protein product, partial [Callosobruchus maculatus]